MKKTSFLLMASLIFTVFSLPSRNKSAIAQEKKGKEDRPKGDQKNSRNGKGGVAVKTIKAEFKILPSDITVVSVLLGRKQADVYSKVTGRVSMFGPKESEPVKTNEVLFRVDRNDPGESFLSTPVLSPITGWVGRWMVSNIGEQVSTQSPVVTVVDDSALRATIYLPTDDWLLVNKNTEIKVTVGKEQRTGWVLTVARAGDPASGRGSVLVEIPNDDHGWRVGMIARVTLSLEPKKRMVIPASSLTITENGAHVFIIADNKAKKQPVSFSIATNDLVEIISGIEDGAQVVILGNNLLSDGADVNLVNDPEKKG